jgi:hypothetical protein
MTWNRNMLKRLDGGLLRVAALILFLTALLKVASALSGVAYLATPDPVLPFLTVRQVLLLSAQVEFVVAALLAAYPRSWYARHSLLSLCATFVVYRAGRYALHVRPPCPCLGRASDWLHVAPSDVDRLALCLLALLASAATVSIMANAKPEQQWRDGKPASSTTRAQ